MLSCADLGLGESHESLPSNPENALLDRALAPDTLSDQQTAFSVQVSHYHPSWQANIYAVV